MQNSSPLYIMLCGLSGSGKTTLRREIVAAMGYEVTILSTDDYIDSKAAVAGRTYTSMFELCIKAAEANMNAIRTFSINNRLNIIHDQTNLTASSRAKKLAGIPSSYAKVCIFLIPPDEEELSRRLADRPGKTIPPNVMGTQKLLWEPPTRKEDFDNIVPAYMWRDVLTAWLV